MQPAEASRLVKHYGAQLGFERCGIARAAPLARASYVEAWLDSGRGGTMDYMHRYLAQRIDPTQLLDGAKSVIVVALNYNQPHPSRERERPVTLDRGDPHEADAARGKVAVYAWGDDYHDVLRTKLNGLLGHLRTELHEGFAAKVCVDTAPVIEREWAAASGVGWIGKNTLVLHESLGSYFFLGVVVTTLELEPDAPALDHCGTCTACLDACPTAAFPAPYEMDASRCVSYLTIEHRGAIAEELHESMGSWVFGCDICQEVCPHNRRAPTTTEPRFAIRPPGPEPVLDELLHWSPDDYRTTLKGSAMRRAKLDMLQRNARIARTNERLAASQPEGSAVHEPTQRLPKTTQ